MPSPDANVGRALCGRAAVDSQELVGVDANLKDVVGQRKERREGEGRHKQREKAKLQDHLKVLGEHAVLREGGEVEVLILPRQQPSLTVLELVGRADLSHFAHDCREDHLHHVVDGLAAHHDDKQLDGQLKHAAVWGAGQQERERERVCVCVCVSECTLEM